MKPAIVVTLLAALVTTSIQARPIGLYLGAQLWQSEANGSLGEEYRLFDANLEKKQQTSTFVEVVHPFPLLPNVRLSTNRLNSLGSTTLTQAAFFNGENFLNETTIDTQFKLSYVDYTFFYQAVNSRHFSFDLGVSARNYEGEVTVSGLGAPVTAITNPDTGDVTTQATDITSTLTSDETVAMLYAATHFNLPIRNLSAFAHSNYLLSAEHSFYDYQLGLSYQFINRLFADLNLNIGYQVVRLRTEDVESLATDLEFNGTFVGISAHF